MRQSLLSLVQVSVHIIEKIPEKKLHLGNGVVQVVTAPQNVKFSVGSGGETDDVFGGNDLVKPAVYEHAPMRVDSRTPQSA